MDAQGVVALYFMDQNGKERARFGIFEDLAVLNLLGKSDERGSGLSVFGDGRAELTLQSEGKLVHFPSVPGHHWVLWGQRKPFEVPIGAWSSQNQCVEQRIERQQTLPSWTLSCLPENVEPGRQ